MTTLARLPERIPAAQVWNRITLRRDDRALLIGGTRSGKSTLADYLGQDFLTRYARLRARRLILDTKPRFRAEWHVNGTTTKWRYRHYSQAPLVPDSVLVDDPGDLKHAWALGHRTVIVQVARTTGATDIHAACLQLFIDDSRHNRPQLAQFDEALDWFHTNGTPRYEVVLRVPRAGAERGTASTACTQRTKGFGSAWLELMNLLYAFRMDSAGDAKRFGEFGCPGFVLPRRNRDFRHWSKDADRDTVYGPYYLDLAA